MVNPEAEFGPQPAEAKSFARDTVAEAAQEALFGQGVAYVESLGITEAERERLVGAVTSHEYTVGNGAFTDTAHYFELDQSVRAELLSPILGAINDAFPDYFVANMQYIRYMPGASINEHYDFGNETDTVPAPPDKSLSFIWVLRGSKDLVVWPKAKLDQPSSPQTIQQKPDMLIVLRGGAFENEGVLYPAIKHGAPAVAEESGILTFELASIEDEDG